MKGFHSRSRLMFGIPLVILFLCLTASGQTTSNSNPSISNLLYPVLVIGLLALNIFLWGRMKKIARRDEVPLSDHGNESHITQKNDDQTSSISEHEYNEIFQLFGHPTVLIDPNQKIIAVNRAFERISGLSEKELCGKKCHDVFHGLDGSSPPDRCPFEKIRRAENPEAFDMELELFGGAYWLSCKPIMDDQNRLKKVIHIATDILDRRNFEKKLYSLSIKLETILTEIPDIVAEVNENKVYTWINSAGFEFFGDDVIGKEAAHYFEGDNDTYQKVQPIFNGDENVVYLENWQRRRDGQKRLLAWWCRTLKDQQGRIKGALSTARDITDLRASEEALRISETKFRSLFNHAGDGIIIHDFEGRILEVNDAICERLGYTREELHEMKPFDLDTPEFATLVPQRLAILEKQGHAIFESAHRRKDGTAIPVEVNVRVVELSGQHCILSIVRDLRERHEAEKALRESEAKYRKLLANLKEAVFIIRRDRTVVFCDGAVHEILGYQPEELIDHSTRIFYEDDQQFDYAGKIYSRLSRGEHFVLIEVNLQKKDGTIIKAELHGTPFDKDHITCVIRDISLLEKAKKERESLEDQLRQSQKMEAIGFLAGGVAHDFNNLLMAILGYCDLAMQHIGKDNPAFPDLQEIKNASNRAATLTRQLLAFSRKQMLQPEVLNLNELISNMLKMLRRMIGEDIDLNVLPATDLGLVQVDPGQIEQIIMNLAVNARDAMPQGGRLTIETTNVEIDEGYSENHLDIKPGSYIQLAVCDTGCGMDKATQNKIFDPFFTTKEKGKGTGLGLSTVYGIVKQSGGSIYVYSEPGKGTTFKIYLKRVDHERKPDEVKSIRDSIKPGWETILLVEDEDVVRNLIARTLQSYHYTVLKATHGEEAIRLANDFSSTIHLLLTDVVMPKMSGREMATLIQQKRPDIKILFMSGYTDNAIVHHGMLDEGVHFIQKPFHADDLMIKIRHVLDQT